MILTNERIIIKKEKGIFKKIYKEIDEILLKDIKIYNDDIQVKNKKGVVEVKTVTKNIKFHFSDYTDAKKFTNKIIDILTGTTFIKRVSSKVMKVINTVDDAIGKNNRVTIVNVLSDILLAKIGINFLKKK